MVSLTMYTALKDKKELLIEKYGEWEKSDPKAWEIFVKPDIDDINKALNFLEKYDINIFTMERELN